MYKDKITFIENKKLLRFVFWFFLANACLFWLIGIRYLVIVLSSKTLFITSIYFYNTIAEKMIVLLFAITSYLGHFALLAFLPCILMLPLAILFKKSDVVIPMAIVAWSIGAILLAADNMVFSLFHFHINIFVLKVIFNNGFINFLELSVTELYNIAAIVAGIIGIEIIFAFFIWHKIILANRYFIGRKILVFLIGCLFVSYSAFVITIANNNNVLAQQTPNFPLYNNIVASLLPLSNSLALINRYSETRFSQPLFPVAPLNYPIHRLHCEPYQKPYNIIIIGIDTWRFDSLNKELTPNIQKFSQNAFMFKNHYSGGNSTQAGLFSLFYGIPSNYWTSMLEQQRGALLIHELLNQGYQTKIFFSSNMIPPFHKTIFAELKGLRIKHAKGKSIPDQDRSTTEEFINFMHHRDKHRPFFAFLFYNAAHSYYSAQNIPKVYPTSDGSAQRLINNNTIAMEVMNRYRNALHFIDSEVQKILAKLKQQKLIEQTIIILTSDHGEEFNDNHLAYWGHCSNYTRYQIETPFVVYWPGKKPSIINYQTSHYDVAPFLLSKILGCKNPISDYSVGEDLFKVHNKPYLLVGGYYNMSIVEKTKNTTLLTTGNIQILDSHANELAFDEPDIKVLTEALLEMRKYYQQASPDLDVAALHQGYGEADM